MSVARAPGKIVLSGAYAVLEGSPAIVAAVDRFVIADSARAADLVTEEVKEAIGNGSVPWFDASALRDRGQKLGLGSSAAILVASLAALELDTRPGLGDAELCKAVFSRALGAHARAQHGGSGIDVAASAHGGVLLAERSDRGLDVRAWRLPAGLVLEVWAAGHPASTRALVSRVRALRTTDAARWQALVGVLDESARAAVGATSTRELVDALGAQARGLDALGLAAGAEIVTDELRELARTAAEEGAVFMPSGAGGGDVAIFAADHPPSKSLATLAIEKGLTRLDLAIGARGVHASR